MHAVQKVLSEASWLRAACASAWLLATGVQGEEAAAPALTAQQIEQHFESAMRSIEDGNPQTAIDRHIEPIIAHFEALTRDEQRRFYSANSMGEAIYYAAQGQIRDRLEGTQKGALVLGGEWSSAMHLKGYALVELEEFEAAKNVYRRGLELAPKNAMMWSELGVIYQVEKNWPESLAAYTEAESAAELSHPPDSKEPNRLLARALRGQGFVRIEMGELDVAEALFNRCLQMDPEDQGAKEELAYIARMRRGKPKEP